MNLIGKYPAIVRSWIRGRRECRVEIPGLTDGADIFPLAEIAYSIGDKSEHTEIRVVVGDRVWVEFEGGDSRYPLITHWRTKRVGNDSLWRRWHHENLERVADAGDIHDEASRDILTEAGRDKTTDVGRNESRTVAQEFTLNAGAKITLHVGASTMVMTASGVTITTPDVKVDSPLSTFTGQVIVQGLLTFQSGMVGSGGAGGASATINGGVRVINGHKLEVIGGGDLEVVGGGDVKADAIGLKTHHHNETGSVTSASVA